MAIRKISGAKPEIQQGFVNTIEDLATVLRGIDQRQWNAFFACAAFDPSKPQKRTHENALCARSFWLDLDAGPKKPYENAEAAIVALDAFVEACGFPLPTVVESGNGVHAWWTLDMNIPAEMWSRAAGALKELCRARGLHADPARTADVSSILRAPQTHNWKDMANPKEVVCDELMPPVDTRNFLLQLAAQAPVSSTHAPQPSAGGIGAAMMNVPKPPSEPSFAAVAVQHCRQLQYFRDSKGNIEEPLWYAGLCVLAHCEDGEQLAHEWSSGHPQYTPIETTSKLMQGKAASGPTTCARFQDLNPAGCQGCPHQISSPILLGRGHTITAPPVQEPDEGRPPLPWGYKWGRNMELCQVITATKDEPAEDLIISQYAIYLSGLRTAENRVDARGYVFQQWFPHEGWVQFEVGADEFMGSSGRQILGRHGVLIHPNHWLRFVNYVHKHAVILRGMANDDKRFDQFGWKHMATEFILGPVLYRNDGTKHLAAGSKELEQRAKQMVPQRGGSLAAWTEAADRLFMPGCEPQAFALLSSFAAPLMHFVSGDEGGAILSLYSAQSGTGKTTALDAAASVWGSLDALRLINMDTNVAKFRSISVLSNLPVLFDEMFGKDPTVVQEFVRAFTTGRDRKRGQRDGSVNNIENTWQTIMIVASNQSLIDNLATGGGDPQAARIFELEALLPKSIKTSSSKALRDAFMMNRGYAGIAFIEQLLKPGNIEWVVAAFSRMLAHYEETLKANSEHRFMVRHIAAVALASHIVTKAGILHFDTERMMSWIVDRAGERVASYISFDGLMAFKTIINENMQDCIVVTDRHTVNKPTTVKKQPMRQLRMRYEIKPQRLYIPADVVRRWLTEANKPYGAVMKALYAEGVLLNHKVQRSLGAGTDYIAAQVTCWEIDMGQPTMSGEMKLVEHEAAVAAHEK